jgi:putative spermidine/putrescine transport system substrate-binding protein
MSIMVGALASTSLAASASAGTHSTAKKKVQLSGSVTILTPAGGVATGMATVLQGFTAQTGVSVTVVPQVGASSFGQISAQASNPVISVVMEPPGPEVALQAAGYLAQLPKASIPNEKLISKNILDRQQTSKFAVVQDSDTQGLEYNANIFASKGFAPPTSFTDLWNPQYCGHVAIYGPDVPAMEAFLNFEADAHHGSAKNLGPAYTQFKALAPCLEPNGIKETTTAMDQGFQQGLTWIAFNSSSRAGLLKASGLPIGFSANKAEPLIQFHVLSLVRGGPNQAASLALINYLLSKPAQNAIVSDIDYAPVERGIVIPPAVSQFETDVAYGGKAFFTPNWYVLVPNQTKIIQDFNSIVG